MDSTTLGIIACLAVGLATAAGGLPVLFARRWGRRILGGLLGFGGGVMLAATAFSLILPGTEAAIERGASEFGAALIMAAGIALGAAFLALAHEYFPHEHFFKGMEGRKAANLKRIWLFVGAIALHNFPEGLAVGVSFGSDDITHGITTALGIGLQNLPEGLAVALSLVGENYSAPYALWIGLLTGVVEPLGGFIGLGVVNLSQALLPWSMAFAAGAMLFVICDEIVPESQERGQEREGTIGIVAGFIVMMVLDISLG